MDPETKTALKEIFARHGLDPFDVFLLNEADWPLEAKDFMKAQRQRPPEAELETYSDSAISEWEARAGEKFWYSGVE